MIAIYIECEESHRSSNLKGSGGRHNIVNKDSSTIGTRHMSDEEDGREIAETRVHLDILKEIIQEMENEYHLVGWNLKKKIKWPIRQLFARKLRKKMKIG